MRVRKTIIGLVTAVIAVAVIEGAAPAQAAPPTPTDHAAPAGHPTTGKPVPQAPADAYRPGHPRVVEKPRTSPDGAQRSLVTDWRLTVSASATTLWPTQYSTLQATVGTDVGPTPYYILIFDTGPGPNGTSGTLIASCGSGTSCRVSVTQPRPTFEYYDTVVAPYSTTYPPAGIQARSTRSVGWATNPLTLNATSPTVAVGQTAIIGAVADSDVGPTPFYLTVYDATTGQKVATCGTGRVCNAFVSSSEATTHRYVAYWGPNSAGFPPAGFLSRSPSAWQTWSATGWGVSMAQDDTVYTAFVNRDLGPTPYFLQIYAFNDGVDGTAPTGTRLGACGTGTSCQVTMARTTENVHVVAFVSGLGDFVPPDIQGSSWVFDKPVIIW
jgi:hypothetical protein